MEIPYSATESTVIWRGSVAKELGKVLQDKEWRNRSNKHGAPPTSSYAIERACKKVRREGKIGENDDSPCIIERGETVILTKPVDIPWDVRLPDKPGLYEASYKGEICYIEEPDFAGMVPFEIED